ncbi:uncharacterized protein LOC115241223 isoform X1 [Formica exsecta]|uniref:uncharacterized protein LOC115241223 isoform X1 n=2 Tax=Formica exsecta TaxID=72781 RepID=UPI001142C1BE|nr:uncharacterized protein LOC115241223 isoform X1 [Formica exsecta]
MMMNEMHLLPAYFAVMSEDPHQEMLDQINKAQMELKIRLEQVSKLRIDCARMQLELLKLYKPQCLEILESLRIVSEPAGPPGNDDDDEDVIGSRIDNEKVFMLKYIYYILNIGLTHRPCIRNAVYNVNA